LIVNHIFIRTIVHASLSKEKKQIIFCISVQNMFVCSGNEKSHILL